MKKMESTIAVCLRKTSKKDINGRKHKMRLSTTAMVEIDASNASSIDTQESASIQVTNCATRCASMEANGALKSSNSAACFGDARVSTETSRIVRKEKNIRHFLIGWRYFLTLTLFYIFICFFVYNECAAG